MEGRRLKEERSRLHTLPQDMVVVQELSDTISCGEAKVLTCLQPSAFSLQPSTCSINWLLINAVVLLYGAVGEPLKSETADQITDFLRKAYGEIEK